MNKEITIYRSGLLNACASIYNLNKRFEILRAVNNDGDWAITIRKR